MHEYDSSQYHCSRSELEEKLNAVIGKTLGEVDKAHVFRKTKTNPKVTGIAGDVIEQSVIGYPANSSQKPDLNVDGQEVELKTTGLRKSKKMKGLEAKEPMSITAVSLDTIADEDFEHSNFLHKVDNMLLVYYLYDSPKTVVAAEYARFPIMGYQLYRLSKEDKESLRNDWQIVHDFIKKIQDEHPDEKERKALYPKLSSALRNKLLLIDTAPKYPNPPRFRLKRSTVTAIARRNFGESMYQLPRSYTSYRQVDAVLHTTAQRFYGHTLREMAESLGLNARDSKNVAERVVAKMFGSSARSLSQIELFAKTGIKAKSIVLTKGGMRTEDMKLFTIDFNEFASPDASFETSPIREYFSEGSMICVVLEEPSHEASLMDNTFLGFKRIAFSDEFIDSEVKKTYEEIDNLIRNHRLKFVSEVDQKTGEVLRNRSGEVRGAPNFPKSRDHVVFVRGTGSDSTDKRECVNGIRMYYQQIWIKGSYMAERLKSEDWI